MSELLDVLLGRREPTPHVHDRRGWAGDVWDFGDDEDAPTVHVAKWRCSCGTVWTESKPADEFPNITGRP